jgi:hypothetical protein
MDFSHSYYFYDRGISNYILGETKGGKVMILISTMFVGSIVVLGVLIWRDKKVPGRCPGCMYYKKRECQRRGTLIENFGKKGVCWMEEEY